LWGCRQATLCGQDYFDRANMYAPLGLMHLVTA
jgi:hypothetical protein